MRILENSEKTRTVFQAAEHAVKYASAFAFFFSVPNSFPCVSSAMPVRSNHRWAERFLFPQASANGQPKNITLKMAHL